MKYTNITRGALALALGVMTSATFAAYSYDEGFELLSNDYAITNHADWKGGPDDLSKVVPSNYTFTAASTPLSGAHTKVLQLNTEGGTLTNELPLVASFATEDVYVDTMVQFVPSEDLPDLGDDDDIKIAVYSYISTEMVDEVEVTSTNLAIYHAAKSVRIEMQGEPGEEEPVEIKELVLTNTVTTVPVDAAEWYRLTIRLGSRSDLPVSQGFQIYLNGVLITNNVTTNNVAFEGETFTNVNWNIDNPSSNGTWFISAGVGGTTYDSIAAVQFKGTGYIDDLVVTTTAPGYEYTPPTTFEVTQTVGDNGSGNDETSPITVNVGSTTSLTYTASEFYRIATLTTNDVEIGAAATAKSYTVVAGVAMDIDVTFAMATGYSVGNVSWFAANGWTENDVVEGLDYDMLELLNVPPTAEGAGGTITIEAIEVAGADVKVTVFIQRTASVDANLGANSVLTLYGADDLTGNFADLGTVGIGDDLDATQNDIRKDLTIAAAGGKKFYKAVIQTAP